MAMLVALFALFLLQGAAYSQSFSFDVSTKAPGLQVDSTGRTFLAADNYLYRLDAQLVQEERVDLGAIVINRGLALSSTGMVVVCLEDLSCSVYNASNLSAGPIRSVSNAIASADPDFGAAVFTSGDTFYTGASTGVGERMVLQQFGNGFNRSSDNNPSGTYNELVFGVNEFARQFYGGFVSGDFAYYVVADYQPITGRAIRLLRVCNMPDCGGPSTCEVTALYELGINCGSRTIGPSTRVCGVSLVEDFSGISGPIAVITICTPGFTIRNSLCLVDVAAVNEAMDAKYDSCIDARTYGEGVGLAWRTGSSSNNCELLPQVPSDRCDTPTPVGVLALRGGSTNLAPSRVNFGGNVPTVSVAVKIEQFSFVFVATDDMSIRGYDLSGASLLGAGTTFYNQSTASMVHQLSWQEGQIYITAATDNSVFQVPIEECSQHIDCTSCTNDPNPLCGWCVVENKCSRQTQCQNSNITSRWTQDNTNCVSATVDPMQLVLDEAIPARVLMVTLTSPGLTDPLSAESFSCHLADDEGRFPPIIVPAVEVTPGTVFSCDIQGLVPDYPGVTATINLGFQSSLFNVSFDITNQALTMYRCSAGESCKDCLRLNSPCGWCNLNKQCSGTSAPCRNASHFLQVSMSTDFTALCPLLDTPPSGGYTIPVRVVQDLRLTTRNLVPPMDGFNYSCSVNGVALTAQYQNQASILCNVGNGDLNLPTGTSSSSVVAMVIWSGNGINHPLSSVMQQTNLTLFDCRNLGSGCSECLASRLGSEFTCGWCRLRPKGSCEVLPECNDDWVTEGSNCPTPFINSISPESGPVEGGTEITVRGTDLGVTFADILNATLTLGSGACTPINTGYITGRQFVCVTSRFGSIGSNDFTMVLYGDININVDANSFIAVNPIVRSVTPIFGPIAGGTTLTVGGNDLGVGNHENTRVTLEVSGGSSYPCNIIDVLPQEIECTTTAGNLTSNAVVVVTIDAARLDGFGVLFSYLNNPNVTAVFPTNTVPSGGITLTFTGVYLDVVQRPVLEVYQPLMVTLRSYCSVVGNTTITCSTPNLMTTSLTPLDYALRVDDAPPTTQARLPISVQSDPSNFRLEGSQDVPSGTVTLIRIVGDNLDSVETSEIRVTVGGEECTKTPSNSRVNEIICTVPLEPPGQNPAIINVTIGNNISQVLDQLLIYTGTTTPVAGVSLEIIIIIPVIVFIFVLVVCVLMIIIVCLYLNSRRKSMSIAMNQQIVELVATGKTQEVVDSTALVKSELDEIAESIPDSFKIAASKLKLSSTAIGQGEFGIVYKGVLTDWNNVPMQGVAVKTLKGLFSLSDVQSMVCEVNKMQYFDHPHVMSLIGVCLDAGPGVAIVMPYMANGSLLDYLKRERDNLELDDDCEIHQILAVRKLLLKMCHQIALGMAYLAEQKFVHRDLAARNCMLDSGGGIRVGDFGLAEDVYASGYFRQNDRANVKVPYKWMALESLNDAIFTEKTDVWSYGVTVWEVFNGGRTPYPAVDPLSLIQLLGEGRRLERPLTAACATEISVVMRKCWREDPEERPTFSQLSSIVERLLASISDYAELGMVLVDISQEKEQLKYDYVPTPTEAPHRYGNLPLSDPITTENSAYGLREEITT